MIRRCPGHRSPGEATDDGDGLFVHCHEYSEGAVAALYRLIVDERLAAVRQPIG